MKKVLSLLLVILMTISLAACGDKEPAPSGDTTPTASQQETNEDSKPNNTEQDDSQENNDSSANEDEDTAEEGWPDNDCTEQVPKPDMKAVGGEYTGDYFNIGFPEATMDDIKAYAEELKNAGFTIDAKEDENTDWGMYAYQAKNDKGYTAKVSFSLKTGNLLIQKPQ